MGKANRRVEPHSLFSMCNYILKAERADREICRLLSLDIKFKKYTKFLLTTAHESVKIDVVNKKCGCGGTGRRAGLRNQCQRRGGSSPLIRTNNASVRTKLNNRYKYHLKRMVFFCCKIAIPKERVVFDMQIIKMVVLEN